jgi:hypothetical protein
MVNVARGWVSKAAELGKDLFDLVSKIGVAELQSVEIQSLPSEIRLDSRFLMDIWLIPL